MPKFPIATPSIRAPLAFLFLAFAGGILYGAPLGPDNAISYTELVGAFLLFLAFYGALICWGAFLQILFFGELRGFAISLGIGSLFLSLFSQTLGHLGFIHFSYRPLALVLLFVGPAFCWIRKVQPFPLGPLTVDRAVSPFLLLWLLVFGGHTFLLGDMPDPLWFHLVGPRLFSEFGSIHLPKEFPLAFHTGLFENHFLWGNLLLGGEGGGGLVAGQLFGQWSHFFIGAFGSFLVLQKICYGLFPQLPRKETAFLALSAVWVSQLAMVSYVAKNDWGSIQFALLAILFALHRNPILGGLFAGAAFGVKYTAYFSLIGFAFLLPAMSGMHYFRLVCGLALGTLPLLGRNFFFTGNPIFPVPNSLFPSPWIGPSWTKVSLSSSPNWDLVTKLSIFSELLANHIFMALGLVTAMVLLVYRKWRRPKLALSILVPIFIFFLQTGEEAQPRWLGGTLLLTAVLGAYAFISTYRRWFPPAYHSVLICIALAAQLVWMGFSVVPLRLLLLTPAEQIRAHQGGRASAWLRLQELKPGEVISASEVRIYYLLPLRTFRIWDDPALDRKFTGRRDPKAVFQMIYDSGFKYMLLTNRMVDQYQDLKVWRGLAEATERHKNALVFDEPGQRIVDVKKMIEAMDSAN